MLTRLEVDGFKNLLGFSVDLGPFNCLAGPNGVGKSNIFDAIRFISLLADHRLVDAAQKVRGSEDQSGDVRDLFWSDGQHRVDRFKIAVEMIIHPDVRDDFERKAQATSTFLRYEIQVSYQEPEFGSLGGLELCWEKLEHIRKASKRLSFPHHYAFRKALVFNKRRGGPFIDTHEDEDGRTEILIARDGGSFGKHQKVPARTTPTTIVSSSNTSATPTILAARREMQTWKMLALEPSAMRCPDPFLGARQISSNGAHLAGTLYRLSTDKKGEDPTSGRLMARVTSRLADLVPVSSIEVKRDEVRQLLYLVARERSGVEIPARSLSDGTMRFLTLCVLGEDPEATGLICMEETRVCRYSSRIATPPINKRSIRFTIIINCM